MKHRVLWDSGSAPGRASRPTRLVPRVGGLRGRTKAPARGTDKEKPPRRNLGGQKEPNRWASDFDRVAALFAFGLGGRDREAYLLAQGAGHKPTDRVRLPAGGFHEFLPGGAAGAPQQVENLGDLAALSGAGCLLGQLGRLRALVGLPRQGGLLTRPGLGRRNVGPVCGDSRLFGGGWRLGRGTGLGAGGFCWNAVHSAFSFGGDYRDPMDHSGSQGLQASSDASPHWRRIGDRGEFGPQIGADGGRW